jgi:natural product biosynthesis luciferase-like monooxygenase protein
MNVEVKYPLSPMQQGMLYHALAETTPGVDLEQIVGTLPEALDPDAFRQAWERTASRHWSFRTTFAWDDGGSDVPLQSVHRDVVIPLEVRDWRHLSPEAQESALEQYLAEDRRRGFSPQALPLMRVTLFRLGESEHQFVWTFPHLLLDGRSFPLILQEIFAHYDAIVRGETLQLDAPRRHQDYVRWLERRDASGDEPFWRELLKGFTTPTQFPMATPAGTDRDRGEQELRLTAAATSRLAAVATTHRLTLNTLVQGAWAILLGRYTGERDVVFGATRAGRGWAAEQASSLVGMFINTVPVRLRLPPETSLISWLSGLRAQQKAVRDHEHAALVDIQRWSELPSGSGLFDTIVVFDNASLNASLRALGGAWEHRRFRLVERTSYPLTLYAYGEPGLLLKLAYDRPLLDDEFIARTLGHLQTLLEAIPEYLDRPLQELPLLTESERQQLISEWNDTATPYREEALVHELFAEQAARTPDRIALACEEDQRTYSQLNEQAERLAARLQRLGAGPGMLVGICVERSVEMLIGLLGILKAGAAYVPLDPEYPKERLGLILTDSGMSLLLTQAHLAQVLPEHRVTTVFLDDQSSAPAVGREKEAAGPPGDRLAYVIYTSGSTGVPKGVMVTHRNVVNLFAGMDQRIGASPPGVWLAVTSLSFDISVLELFWTLCRGFTVVLHPGRDQPRSATRATTEARQPMEFSLFYFASDEATSERDKYRLLVEGAKFGDLHGFAAVWTPERHFHAFGGLYPNPSLTSTLIAAVTQTIKIRAGSVVLPLHTPIRVAEEWAVVDNISGGRVGISFASGWHPNDFVLKPESFADNKGVMRRDIDVVQRLWRGEPVTFPGPDGRPIEVRTLPRPLQAELPIWLTAAGSPDTFRLAGEMGAGLLTHLLGQSIDELEQKVALYRKAWSETHPGNGRGHVTLMLHTFVADDQDAVREIVRLPLKAYLRSSVSLLKPFASAFPAFKRRPDAAPGDPGADLQSLSPEEMESLLDYSFERYYQTSGLFGTPESCMSMIERLERVGVDEVACLIDFGVAAPTVLDNLNHLNALRERCSRRMSPAERDYSIGALIARYGVTHMQCTPSLASMLLEDDRATNALAGLRVLLLGGEALPAGLASRLRERLRGELINMYGPTETTVWSSTCRLDGPLKEVSIGRPIANTEFYIVDSSLQPVPVGIPGELLIGGDGVAAGYLRRPELTAERFIPHPWRSDLGARVYRTGDRVRYLPDGRVEFLGRWDQQVKVRGVRIELGEIETVLSQHASVREAVVVVREWGSGGPQLVAYVVPATGQEPEEAELRGFLRTRLPEAMVPSACVMLDALPRTPNGKIDRARLPAEGQARALPGPRSQAPRDSLERQLAVTWERLLGRRPIGVSDNFFDLGGHSLLAVSLVSELQKIYGIRLPLDILVAAPTIAQLAEALRQRLGPGDSGLLVELQPAGSRPPLYLVHAGSGQVAAYQALAQRLGNEQPTYGLRAPGVLGEAQPLTRIEDLAARYLREIRGLQPQGPYHFAGAAVGGLVAFQMALQLLEEGEEPGLLALIQCAAPAPEVSARSFRHRASQVVRRTLSHGRTLLRLPARPVPVNLPDGRQTSPIPVFSVREALSIAEQGYRPRKSGIAMAIFRSVVGASTASTTDLGWGKWTSGHLDVHEIPGQELTVLEEPNVQALAERLRQCLGQAGGEARKPTLTVDRRAVLEMRPKAGRS